MVLKDFECCKCGTYHELPSPGDVELIYTECRGCGELTNLISVCNGGTKSRYRFCDFPDDPRFYRGQCEISPTQSYIIDDDGKKIETSKERSTEFINQKRDEKYYKSDKTRGRTPLFFDQKNK